MSEQTDADLTLPSVMAALPGRYREEVLVLTLVFHPDPRRIGEAAVLERRGPWTLGRLSPDFGVVPCSGGPLGDQHVSREAVRLSWKRGRLQVRRFAGSSRCRVDGRELEDEVILERPVLREGVPLLLGHGVVLLLRLGAPPQAAVPDQPGCASLKGRSAYMCSLREQIASVGEIDVDVLVRGETGTGKELVATALHRASRRSAAPLVCVNMSAIPPGLAPAALFGSLKGSYTGAERSGQGYFRQAEGGSLFLDEIGDTPPEIQPQLLRALQQREIQPVGAPVRRVDVRVISATDAALEGPGCDFKAALRHRLGACEIVLLPLREHPEDIGELLWHFLSSAAADSGGGPTLPGEGSSDLEIAAWAELFHHFLCYHWPGNVRQLANVAQQMVLARGALPVVPDSVAGAFEPPAGAAPQVEAAGSKRRMQDIGDREFREAMQACRYEAAPVARALGVSRPSVYRRIEETPGLRLAAQVPEKELQEALSEHDGDLRATAMALRVSASSLRARLRNAGR